jgi:hypothetical protein
MRRRFALLTAAALLAGLGAGCGGDQDKGIYSNRDRPTAAPPAKPERPAPTSRTPESAKAAATQRSTER